MADCDLVIETITEDLDAKKQVFAELDRVCGPDIILASNTSTLSLTELAGATTHPERVIGTALHLSRLQGGHGRNHPRTEDVGRDVRDGRNVRRKTPEQEGIMVYESPGFVTTRADLPADQRSDCTLLPEGVASAEDIDDGDADRL